MPSVQIFLFGKLRIEFADSEGVVGVDLPPRRAQELFCYLLLHCQGLHERDKLATLMWPDNPSERSKRYLRQTLWQVQSILDHSAEHEGQMLLVDRDRIGISPGAHYWLDTAVFERAFAAVIDKPGGDLTEPQAELLRQAVQQYRGDLLEGWYLDWCILERERYQFMYLAMLDKLLNYCEVHQAYEAGVAYGMQILRYDRAREQTHRHLMRLYYLAGDRTAAIHQYNACVTVLREELNVDPGTSTDALYDEICAQQDSVPRPTAAERSHGLTSEKPTEIASLDQLEQIQRDLDRLKERVTTLMQTLRQQDLPSS